MEMKKALAEAIVNGIVIGALVAGVGLFSGSVSNTVVIRTTLAAMLMRFSFYMLENVDQVDLGRMGEYLGLPGSRKGESQFLSLVKSIHIGKLI